MTKTHKIQSWRRFAEISQAVIIIGLPFLTINGESALRFDIPTLRLHFFGVSLWMEEFFIVLIVIIFLSLLVIFITLLFGRIWCGWLCPQTVISDFTAYVTKAKNKGIFNKVVVYSSVLLISMVVAANLIWYFVSPREFIRALSAGEPGHIVWGFWIVMSGILFLNFAWLRQTFCSTICPYAKLQSTLFDERTLAIAFDPSRKEECIDCMDCVKTCPVGIDIRNGLDMACIHCAECIDRCAAIMEPRKKKSLVGYFFGLPGQGGKIVRQNALLFGTVTAGFLVLLIFLLSARVPIDMTVLPNYSFAPSINRKGAVINSYILSIRNRGRENTELKVNIRGMKANIKVNPDRVLHMNAGETRRVTVYITAEDLDRRENIHDMEIIIQSLTDDTLTVVKRTNFVIPEVK
jgi:cytochrome c oxidase accessory protein FixG